MTSNYGPLIQIWYVTNDILHHNLNMTHVRDEIRRLSQRFADRLEEYTNILTTIS